MENGTPSAVREVVPTASLEQICEMCKLWRDGDSTKSDTDTRVSKNRRSKKSAARRKRKRPEKRSRSKKPVLDVMKEVKSRKEVQSGELDLFGSNFPVPSPTEDKWTKQLRTLVQNVGVDRGSVEIDLDDSETDSLSSEGSVTKSKRSKEIINNEAIFEVEK